MDRRYKKKMNTYWAKELRKSKRRLDRLDIYGEFSYWHLHPDWYAKGNRFVENRVAVAVSTCELLRYACERLNVRDEAFQAWATLCEDTENNGVYIHTKNSDGSTFPNNFEGVVWDVELPVEYRGALAVEGLRVGRSVDAFGIIYFITL